MSFATEGCAESTLDPAAGQALVNRYAVSFFLTHLAGDGRYEADLSPTEGVEFDRAG